MATCKRPYQNCNLYAQKIRIASFGCMHMLPQHCNQSENPMKKLNKAIVAMVALTSLGACMSSYPTIQAPGLTKPKIDMTFFFPKGSTCRVNTSKGTVVQNTIPGGIEFSISDRKARSSCTLPDGKTVSITAHHHVPANSKIAGITVYPTGEAFLTTDVNGTLTQTQLTDTVR